MRRAILLVALGCLPAAGCGSSSPAPATTTATTTTSAAKGSPGSKLSFNAKPDYAAPSASTPLSTGLVRITYREFTAYPEVVRAKAGTTIEWRSEGPGRDNVTSQSGPERFASPDFGAGGTFRVRLTRPGIYHYISTLHSATINGTIEIVSR